MMAALRPATRWPTWACTARRGSSPSERAAYCHHVGCPHWHTGLCHQYFNPPDNETGHDDCGFVPAFAAYAGQDPATTWSRFGERAPSEFAVVADEPIDGLAQRVEQLEDVDDAEAAARLEPGVRPTVSRSAPSGGSRTRSSARSARLRDRRLVEDLGEASSSFEILGLHVPTGGRARSTSGRARPPSAS